MFNDKYFYHEHIRKAIISFGTVFNNITIKRTNSDGDIVQSMLVPLSYAPKQKILARVLEVANLEEGRAKYEVTLPRIGFEITSLSYDASRKLVPIQTVKSLNTTNDTMRFSYVSTPYNMGISMSIFSKNQEDGLQIIEQVLPYFNPDFNVTINEISELGVKRDIQFVLDSVNYDDQYMGDFDKRLAVVWDLNFTVKINFFGYVDNANVIKKTIQTIYNDEFDPQIGFRNTTTVTSGNADNYTFIEEFDQVYSDE